MMLPPFSSSSQNRSDYPPPAGSSSSWGAYARTPENPRPLEHEPKPEIWRPVQAHVPATASSNWIRRLLPYWPEALVGIIAFVIFKQEIGTTSLWFDEAWSFGLANQTLDVMRHYQHPASLAFPGKRARIPASRRKGAANRVYLQNS